MITLRRYQTNDAEAFYQAVRESVTEKLGFKLEGIARKSWQRGDAWLDSVDYALLKEDWVARGPDSG